MTQFASKTPRDLVSHPDDSEFERDMSDAEWRDAGLPWIVQHNEPNPILVAAREGGAIEWLEQIIYYGDSLSGGWIGDMKVLPDHIDHARKVLTRLSSLAGKAALEG